MQRIVPRADAFFETCLSFVPPGPAAVLELGSGTGYATERLLRHHPDARVTCLDFSPGMLRAARSKRALRTVRFVEADIRGDWPEGPFDVVLTTLCLHHLGRAVSASGPSTPNVQSTSRGRRLPWTAVTTVGAPLARALHTAVWTGSEMIVWGGYWSGGYLNDAWSYMPGRLFLRLKP